MEIVGVIQYRLIGNHPAAQGRNATISFPGETILLSDVIAKLVKENSINENRYKLDVVRLTSPPGSSVVTTEPIGKSTVLQNYDRITVNITTLQLQDALATAEEAHHRDEEEREREGDLAVEAATADFVFGRRLEDEHGGPASLAASAAAAATATTAQNSAAHDAHALERATRMAAKRFPVAPGKQKPQRDESNTTNNGDEVVVVCDLCDMAPFDPRVLPCCGSTVCTSCHESASLMTPREGECPVCGWLDSDASRRGGGTTAMAAPTHPSAGARAGAVGAASGSLKRERGESKLFSRSLAQPSSTVLAATAHLTPHPRRDRTTSATSSSGPSSGTEPDKLFSSGTTRHANATVSLAAVKSEGGASYGVTSELSDAFARPPCVDAELLAYEKKLQQHMPTIARILSEPEPPVQ